MPSELFTLPAPKIWVHQSPILDAFGRKLQRGKIAIFDLTTSLWSPVTWAMVEISYILVISHTLEGWSYRMVCRFVPLVRPPSRENKSDFKKNKKLFQNF